MKYELTKLANRLDAIAADLKKTAALKDWGRRVVEKIKSVIDAVKAKGMIATLKGVASLVKTAPEEAARKLIEICGKWLDDVEAALKENKKLKEAAGQQKQASFIVHADLDIKGILLALTLISTLANSTIHVLEAGKPAAPPSSHQQVVHQVPTGKESLVKALTEIKDRTDTLKVNISVGGFRLPSIDVASHNESLSTKTIIRQQLPAQK